MGSKEKVLPENTTELFDAKKHDEREELLNRLTSLSVQGKITGEEFRRQWLPPVPRKGFWGWVDRLRKR